MQYLATLNHAMQSRGSRGFCFKIFFASHSEGGTTEESNHKKSCVISNAAQRSEKSHDLT